MRALKLHRAPRRHEEVFGAHYTRLVEYARSLCSNVTAAEELVHEAYVLFVTARPNLELIDRPDAYLAVIVKNVYLSEIRRAARFAHEPIEILEYDTAELGLRHTHPLTNIETRETLVRLCRYALLRRTSSKAGSVLVLRYFLGYYPAEIALLARSATRAVDDLLVEARREARQHLEHPEKQATFVDAEQISAGGADFLEGLRTSIFQHRHDRCLSRLALRKLYVSPALHPIDAMTLSEIVTCASCLHES